MDSTEAIVNEATVDTKITEADIQQLVANELEPALNAEWDTPGEDWKVETPSIDPSDALIGLNTPIPKKIYAISDVHTEFYDTAEEVFDSIEWQQASHLVLAGDIGVVCTKLKIYKEFLLLCKKRYKNVVLIPGNHEYYKCRGDRGTVEKLLKSLCETTGVVYIHEKNVVVDGIRFIGHTLWSIIERDACSQIADFTNGVFNSQLEYVLAFADGFRFVQNEILKSMDYDEPLVVVTHHLPTRKVIHPRFTGYGSMNSAFATDLTSHMTLGRVKYWFCGHTHEYAKTKAFDTLIVVNPLGYPGESRMTKVSGEVFSV